MPGESAERAIGQPDDIRNLLLSAYADHIGRVTTLFPEGPYRDQMLYQGEIMLRGTYNLTPDVSQSLMFEAMQMGGTDG